MTEKRMHRICSDRQKKKRLFWYSLVILFSLLLIYTGMTRSGKYFSWEKAVQEELEAHGYGEPEVFLQERDGVVENDVSGFFLRHRELPGKWVLVKMSEGEQIEVQLVREGFLWQAVRCYPQEQESDSI